MSPSADRPVVRIGGASEGPGESLEAAPRRLPHAVVTVLVVLALLVITAVVADGPWRRHEAGQLAERAAAAQRSIDFTDRRIAGTVQYASPQLTSAAASPGVRADLQRLVREAAAGRLQPLRERRAAVAATRVAPWHGDELRARSATLDYLDERLRLLEAVSIDLRKLYEPTPDLVVLRGEAADALSMIARTGPVSRSSGLTSP